MHLSQKICQIIVWYHLLTLEYQEKSFIVEVFMTLFGTLLVAFYKKKALLSDVDISQPLGQGVEAIRAEKRAGMRDRALGIRWSSPFV